MMIEVYAIRADNAQAGLSDRPGLTLPERLEVPPRIAKM